MFSEKVKVFKPKCTKEDIIGKEEIKFYMCFFLGGGFFFVYVNLMLILYITYYKYFCLVTLTCLGWESIFHSADLLLGHVLLGSVKRQTDRLMNYKLKQLISM